MDPVMYIASSQLEHSKQEHADAIEDFYQSHGHLPFRARFKGVAAVYRRIRALVHAQGAKGPGIVPPAARMVK